MKLALFFVIVFLGLVSLLQPTRCLTIDIHQAEDGVTLGGVSTETGPYRGYTGDGYVDFTGGQGAFLLWDVNAAFDGTYNIAIRYASPTKRPMDLYVDNVKQNPGYEISPTRNWNDWRQESIMVRLSAGSHQIKLTQLTSKGPNVDWMSIEGPMDGRSTVLEPGHVLLKGQFLYSPSGLFKAGLDDSGQLVIQEEPSSTSIWSSGKTGGHFCYMQIDGNLVVRDAIMNTIWSSETFGPGAHFAIGDLGLGAVLLGDIPLWTANRAATALMNEQSLLRGEFKPSPSGYFKIGLGNNGELVVVDSRSNAETWRSGKTGGQMCIMQQDGNLVVRNQDSAVIWTTGTGGHPGARLTIDDTGMASIMLGTTDLWNLSGRKQARIKVDQPVQNRNTLDFEESVVLNPRQSLPKGTFAFSPAGNYKVSLNGAGNLIFQDSGDRTIWDAKVSGGVEAYMQPDGNLVVRDASQRLIWTTHTSGNHGARLVVDDGGRLSVVLGSTPIWMEGIPRGKYIGPPSADLQYPLRGLFYYPWYPETWTVNGKEAHFIPDLGKYSSDDPRVVDEHLEALEYAFTDVAIASWWGPGTQKLSRISHLMDETVAQHSQIKWTVYYEEESTMNPSVEKIRDDLNYLREWFAWHPAWAHINGKPIVFVYNEAGCGLADRWKQGIQAAEGDWYVILKLFPGFKGCRSQPDSWHQYGPASEYIHIPGEAAVVSPGFWRADRDRPELARVSKARFCENVQKMVQSGEDWQLVTTFNECGEGTHVEASSPNWGSETKYGYYLDCLHQYH